MAGAPPKSSNFRGVTLFRPSGRWRAQISAGGKTTSLGDHDTEAAAARAFDRAAINKHGRDAKTNFPLGEYAEELAELTTMPTPQLVAMLRARARKSGTQTSRHRGVSLLKQTGRWHSQINVAGKQVHLGFYGTEEDAARAYDRAAINKGTAAAAEAVAAAAAAASARAGEGGGGGGGGASSSAATAAAAAATAAASAASRVITNFPVSDYAAEVPLLAALGPARLVAGLGADATRKRVMALLAKGFTPAGVAGVWGPVAAQAAAGGGGGGAGALLLAHAERAPPKPTRDAPMAGAGALRASMDRDGARDAARAAAAAAAAAGSATPRQGGSPSITPLASPSRAGSGRSGASAAAADGAAAAAAAAAALLFPASPAPRLPARPPGAKSRSGKRRKPGDGAPSSPPATPAGPASLSVLFAVADAASPRRPPPGAPRPKASVGASGPPSPAPSVPMAPAVDPAADAAARYGRARVTTGRQAALAARRGWPVETSSGGVATPATPGGGSSPGRPVGPSTSPGGSPGGPRPLPPATPGPPGGRGTPTPAPTAATSTPPSPSPLGLASVPASPDDAARRKRRKGAAPARAAI